MSAGRGCVSCRGSVVGHLGCACGGGRLRFGGRSRWIGDLIVDLTVYRYALELVGELQGVVRELQARDRNLADQLQRAATSVVLNIAEGDGLRGKRRVNHFEIALGSAKEVNACLDLCTAWGHCEAPASSVRRVREIRAMLASLAGVNRGRR